MTNAEIAQVLRETAQLMLLADENAFKARAYENAADAIRDFPHPVMDLVNAGRAVELEGVGKSIASSLAEILERGSFQKRDELLEAVPIGLLELLRIKGLGPKKIQALWQERSISTLSQLQAELKSGALDDLKGMGGKTKDALLQAIAFHESQRGRLRLPDALAHTERLLPLVASLPQCTGARPTGGLLRSLPVVDALEFVVAVPPGALTLYDITKHLGVTRVTYELTTSYGTFTCHHPAGLTLLLHEVAPAELDAAAVANSFPIGTNKAQQQALAPYPPETWDNVLAYPSATVQPEKLVTQADIKGILHAHSTYSDGQHTLREMAQACIARGYQYLGITDHSRTASYAGGLSIERVKAQHAEIDALNEELAPFRIFKGIESDILADGSLDYPDDVLASFDFVIASIHAGFNMTEAEATERLIRAAQNPYCTLLGHPTGRLLLAREGYPVNLRALIDACGEAGTAIELNSHPYRLDLDWQWLPYAAEKGVLTSLNPDAHSTHGLGDVQWGIRAARKGLVTAQGCLNCRPVAELAAFFHSSKARAHA